MQKLAYAFDYICPYCYIMMAEVKKLVKDYHYSVKWLPIEIFPQTPKEGILMKRFFGISNMEKMQKQVELLAMEKGIPYYQPKLLYNTHMANLLTTYAEYRINVFELIEELFYRVFVYNENIAELHILQKVCNNVGIDFEKFQWEINKGALEDLYAQRQKDYDKSTFETVPLIIADKSTLIQGVCSCEELDKMMK